MTTKQGDYQKVANKKDLQEGGLLKVEPDGKSIVLSMVNGKVYAMDSVCTHEGGPLEDGILDGYEVECPWHGSKFDVTTGEVRNPPASEAEPTYKVKVEEATGDILISLDTSGAPAVSSEQQKQQEQQQRTSSPSAVSQRQQNEQEGVVDVTKADSSKEKRKPNEYELTLLEKHKHNSTDVVSFKFSKQDTEQQQKKELDYIAGQYAFFDIGGVYNDPEGPIRHFTISSSPTEDFIMISTRIRDTPYKKRLSSLEENTKVKVRGPQGKFVLHDKQEEDYSKTAVFLSGGIGVTPFRSIIKYATDKQLPIKIVMFDSNRNQENILFKSEFDEWANTNKNLKIIYTITEEQEGEKDQLAQQSSPASEWKGEKGRIDKAMLTRYLTDKDVKDSIFYTCGPPGMINAMQDLLRNDLNIPKEQIKVEEFVGY